MYKSIVLEVKQEMFQQDIFHSVHCLDTHSDGSFCMYRVPRPGMLNKRSVKCFILGSNGRSLLKTVGNIKEKKDKITVNETGTIQWP